MWTHREILIRIDGLQNSGVLSISYSGLLAIGLRRGREGDRA
ncbi:hypothetical protein PSP6_260046 [Paraburkholderia tropica]|nr:hypothetical protein PSP6_260046 [Paraburkholderia tropica]